MAPLGRRCHEIARHAELTAAPAHQDARMAWLDFVQWPAMGASLVAAYLVASRSKTRRSRGFWWFLGSNVLWIAWGWHDGAWALVALQVALAAMNIRGVMKNDAA
jgi:hypothetical protein